jgi:hypothetical protein
LCGCGGHDAKFEFAVLDPEERVNQESIHYDDGTVAEIPGGLSVQRVSER